jgi:glycolate oxidase
VAAFFASFGEAAEAVTAIIAAGIVPSLAELLDGRVLAAVDAWQGSDLHGFGEAFLLVQTDGAGAGRDAERVAELLAGSATRVSQTSDREEADALVATRRLALPALERIGRVLIEDICVPRSMLALAARGIEEIRVSTGVDIFTMAHAADGNLHPIIVLDPALAEIPEPAWDAAAQIFGLALRLGGTLTGEHGVGVLKRRWLGEELGPRHHLLQQQLRRTFDPRAMFNPGKAI